MVTAMIMLLGLLIAGIAWLLLAQLRGRNNQQTQEQPSLGQTVASSAVSGDPRVTERRSPPVIRSRTLAAIAGTETSGPAVDQTISYFDAAERKLTEAFDLYERGRTSLATFEKSVGLEAEVVRRAQLKLQADELRQEIEPDAAYRLREDLEAAEIAIKWCLDWVSDLRADDTAGRSEEQQA
jgi:hypothetical protein